LKSSLLDILACPVCKADLSLESPVLRDDEIVSGTLRCVKCGEAYPIEKGIPNLLPPEYRGKPASTLPGAN
jgi:uncharacterized protein YbaR (Trm112 family)